MRKHFVVYYSPGTLVHETSSREIESWDVEKAVAMAATIHERHGSTPFAFQFVTRERGEDDLDSRKVANSPMYYLGGRIETIEEIEARNDPKERILLDNMRYNGWGKVIINDNSWRVTQPIFEGDVILDRPEPVKLG